MDKEERRRLTKEIGLEASYRFFKFAAGSEYLHYGLFESDIPADFQHLKQAQDRYLERLIELIPSEVKTILDVGAGSGKTAEVLTEHGFKVDCVSPGKMLGDLVEARLKKGSTLYRGRFEEVAIPKSYDLVLFSESFQYIPIDMAITKAMSLLKPGGHILICDFFKRPAAGPSPVGGGHSFDAWQTYLKKAPLETRREAGHHQGNGAGSRHPEQVQPGGLEACGRIRGHRCLRALAARDPAGAIRVPARSRQALRGSGFRAAPRAKSSSAPRST